MTKITRTQVIEFLQSLPEKPPEYEIVFQAGVNILKRRTESDIEYNKNYNKNVYHMTYDHELKDWMLDISVFQWLFNFCEENKDKLLEVR